jgi:hypothetical protein
VFRCIALLLGVTTVVGCSAPAPAETSVSLVSERGLVDADVTIVTPVARGKNQLFVQLRPHMATGDARLLAVDATMAAHAHEAHAEAIDETENGFVATDLDLFMTGRWLLTLELSLADEADQVSLPIDVP